MEDYPPLGPSTGDLKRDIAESEEWDKNHPLGRASTLGFDLPKALHGASREEIEQYAYPLAIERVTRAHAPLSVVCTPYDVRVYVDSIAQRKVEKHYVQVSVRVRVVG